MKVAILPAGNPQPEVKYATDQKSCGAGVDRAHGIELKGAQEDWKIVVDIERDADDTLTSIEVTVSEDQINYSKERAENILRAILQRT
jgi:hypothetical protein